MHTMNSEMATRLAAAVDNVPAFPKSAQKILALTRDVSCSPKELVQVIDKDPVVTVKVLRVVNSAYYGLTQPITSIDHAVVFLGFNTIKNLALSIAAIGMMPGQALSGFDSQRYLMHSLTTAGITRQLAKFLPEVDSQDCFIVGLLHDFGQVVLAQFMPAEFKSALQRSLEQPMALHLAMREVVGIDHTGVTAMLAHKWRFADDLVETITHLHKPERCDTDLMACVSAANQISKQLGYDHAAQLAIDELAPTVSARLGGTLEQISQKLGDMRALVEEAQQLSRI